MNLYWTGARGSDTRYTGSLFKGSITIYGNNKNGNISYCFGKQRINHNIYCPESSMFILKRQIELIERQPDCLFMAYNPNYVYGAPDSVMNRTLCLNSEQLMKRLENKIEFRKIADGIIRMIDCDVLLGKDLMLGGQVRESIIGGERVVVQSPVSSGGEGTFLISTTNDSILDEFDENKEYLVSRYIENNIPINAHCVIYDDWTLVLPPSVQIISNEGNRLLYRGADYISFSDVPVYATREFYNQLELICDKLRGLGYRGVIGFDGIVCSDGVLIVEANNRFQGSTYALNCALWQKGLPSVQQLNLEAFGIFKTTVKSKEAAYLNVPYSYCIFINDNGGIHANHIIENAHQSSMVVEHSDDGFESVQSAEENAYLFHILLSTNICSVDSESFRTFFHPALRSPSVQWESIIMDKKDNSAIKIALINQGIIMSKDAKKYLEEECGLRNGEYFNIDLLINGEFSVNCPMTMKFASLSPFVLCYDAENELHVTYYGRLLLYKVSFIQKPDLKSWVTSSRKPISDIAYFSTDRLRLQNSSSCIYNITKRPCMFCEVYNWDLDFGEKDILETIDICFSLRPLPFKHILIGGRSNIIGSEKQTVLNMCSKIKEYVNIPIYLMCLPPSKLSDINEYFNAGINEFGFNIEIFDRSLAKKIMPGKGNISIEQYLYALQHAVDLCGKKGSVRSAFVVGLESRSSLLKGIEAVCRVGATPILSAFRPIYNTPMANNVPLCSAELFSITAEAESIAERYGLSLGPSCVQCQNNTLNIIKERMRSE